MPSTEFPKEGQSINMAKKVGKIKGEIKCHNHTTACYSLLFDFIISAFFLTLLSFYTAAAWRGPLTPPGR